jgi:hypothetical protein
MDAFSMLACLRHRCCLLTLTGQVFIFAQATQVPCQRVLLVLFGCLYFHDPIQFLLKAQGDPSIARLAT